jgi:hypothetical protein
MSAGSKTPGGHKNWNEQLSGGVSVDWPLHQNDDFRC